MKKTKSNKRYNFIFILSIIMVIGVLIISFINNLLKINELKKENISLSEQHQNINEENERLKRIIDGDKTEYIEHAAREKLGYAYPNEKIFYDVTPRD